MGQGEIATQRPATEAEFWQISVKHAGNDYLLVLGAQPIDRAIEIPVTVNQGTAQAVRDALAKVLDGDWEIEPI